MAYFNAAGINLNELSVKQARQVAMKHYPMIVAFAKTEAKSHPGVKVLMKVIDDIDNDKLTLVPTGLWHHARDVMHQNSEDLKD